MTKEQERQLQIKFRKMLKEAQNHGFNTGSAAALCLVLNMCNIGKSTEDIKNFCELLLDMSGKKAEDTNDNS